MSVSKKSQGTIVVVMILSIIFTLVGMTSCSPSETGEQDGVAAEAGSTTVSTAAWSMSSDCASCHTAQAKTTTDSAYLCSIHYEQGNTCVSCHTDETKLTSVHEKAADLTNVPSRLKKTTVEESVCTSCHVTSELVTATADMTLLTDSNGTVVNPHSMPENEDHSALNCVSCHSMHTTKVATEMAPEMCASCHHAGVYECHTCHS